MLLRTNSWQFLFYIDAMISDKNDNIYKSELKNQMIRRTLTNIEQLQISYYIKNSCKNVKKNIMF